MDREGFDPRYNPEFQRGFDPAVHDGPATSAQTHERIPSIPSSTVPRVPPIPPTHGTAQRDVVPPPVPQQEADVDDAVESAADRRVSPWRNPYLIALTVVGVILIAVGIGTYRWAVALSFGSQFGSPSDGTDFQEMLVTSQTAMGLAPVATLAGLLTLLGVIFVVAITWRPGRRFDDEPTDVQDLFPSSSS